MLINTGVQSRVLFESPTTAGVSEKVFGIQTDSVLMTVWVAAITGSITVRAYGTGGDGQEFELFTFPNITSPTPQLLFRAAPVSTSTLRVEAIYSGPCTFEVQARAVGSIVDSSTPLVVGSNIGSYSVQNIVIPNSGTETAISIAGSVSWIRIYNRTEGLTKLAFSAGQSGSNYVTIAPGSFHEYSKRLGMPLNLYIQCTKNNQVLELTLGET